DQEANRDGVRDELIEPDGPVVGLVRCRLMWVAEDRRRAEGLRQVVQLFRRPLVARLLDLAEARSRGLRVGHAECLPLWREDGVVRVQVEGQLPLATRTDELGQSLLAELGHGTSYPSCDPTSASTSLRGRDPDRGSPPNIPRAAVTRAALCRF